MESNEFPYAEVRHILEKYNNPVRFVEEMYGEGTGESVTDLLQHDQWITISNVESLKIRRRRGYCNHVYYPGSFLKHRQIELVFRPASLPKRLIFYSGKIIHCCPKLTKLLRMRPSTFDAFTIGILI
jgi:hypothetical protein